jgi:hypothetical protein
MKDTAKTPEGQMNIVLALRDDKLRRILLGNFDSHTVRWAIGDLFNSPAAEPIMKNLAPEIFVGFVTGKDTPGKKVILEMIATMAFTDLKMEERMKDFNHYKKKEDENIHVNEEDMRLFRTSFSSEEKVEKFLEYISTPEGMTKIIPLLRTQKIRPELDLIMEKEEGRKMVAKMLMSDEGMAVLEEIMKTPEGVNLVGYLWNMPNGKKMIKENMLNFGGIKTLYKIMGFQQKFNAEEERVKKMMKSSVQPE